jgi:hypothetical protein
MESDQIAITGAPPRCFSTRCTSLSSTSRVETCTVERRAHRPPVRGRAAGTSIIDETPVICRLDQVRSLVAPKGIVVLNRTDPNDVPARGQSKVVQRYRAGESLTARGERFGFSAIKVQRLLVSAGESIHPHSPRKLALTSERVRERADPGRVISARITASLDHTHRGLLVTQGLFTDAVELRPLRMIPPHIGPTQSGGRESPTTT